MVISFVSSYYPRGAHLLSRGRPRLGLLWASAASPRAAMREYSSMLLGSQGRDHPLFQSIRNQFPDPSPRPSAGPPRKRRHLPTRGRRNPKHRQGEKGLQGPASVPSRERRSRKRDGVRGGGAPAARGRGGGARHGAARRGARGCCLGGRPGRRRIVAALNLTWKWLWRTRLSVPGRTDGPTDRRTTEAGAGSRARRPEARVGQAQRRPLCRSAE